MKNEAHLAFFSVEVFMEEGILLCIQRVKMKASSRFQWKVSEEMGDAPVSLWAAEPVSIREVSDFGTLTHRKQRDAHFDSTEGE